MNTTARPPRSWSAPLGVLALCVLSILQGCATGPNANPADPLEPLNRTVFKFNDGLDRAVLKPVATAYQNVTPKPVRSGVSNFFGNVGDVWSFVNNVLQGKGEAAADTFFRVTTNTLWGLGGIFDVATELKIPKHREDFGKTLGHWGFDAGPYIVLPVLGPSSLRDTVGTVVDFQGDLVTRADNVPVRNSLSALRLVDGRANLLNASELLDEAALDTYSFTRDAYLQRRRAAVGREVKDTEERFDLPETQATTPAESVPTVKPEPAPAPAPTEPSPP